MSVSATQGGHKYHLVTAVKMISCMQCITQDLRRQHSIMQHVNLVHDVYQVCHYLSCSVKWSCSFYCWDILLSQPLLPGICY